MRVRLSITMAIVLTALLLLTACVPPKPAQQFTLRVGTYPSLNSLPLFIMQERGFDKKNGLNLVDKSYQSGEAMLKDIAAGSLDMSSTVASQVILSAAERGQIPGIIMVVAANNFVDTDHPVTGVLAANSITRWQDLSGQQVAVNAIKSMPSAAIMGRLKQEAVSNVTLVEIPPANMGLAVASGNVAAATMSEPFLTQSLLRKDGKLLGWIIGGPPFEKVEYTMVVSSANLVKSNPEAVKSYLRAHLQAVKWLSQNNDEACAILARRLNISQEVSQKMKLLHWPLDARHDPALLESMQPLLVDIGMLKAPIPASQLYDETLLNEVLAEKR